MVSVAEKQHERRFRGLLESLQNGRVFKRDQPVKWRCLNCGYVHEGPEAPAACPACAHPQAYFEVLVGELVSRQAKSGEQQQCPESVLVC